MEALKYLETNASRHMEEMKECLRMETISADPKKEGEIKRCGEWLVNKLTAAGFENAKLVPTGGLPAVYADWLHAGPDKPTFMVYGHYDVQPAGDESLWASPPFEPTIRDGNISLLANLDSISRSGIRIDPKVLQLARRRQPSP